MSSIVYPQLNNRSNSGLIVDTNKNHEQSIKDHCIVTHHGRLVTLSTGSILTFILSILGYTRPYGLLKLLSWPINVFGQPPLVNVS